MSGNGEDEFRGDVGDLDVAILRRLPEYREGLGGIATLLSHDDSERLINDRTGGERIAKLLLQRQLLAVSQHERERCRRLIGEGADIADVFGGEVAIGVGVGC